MNTNQSTSVSGFITRQIFLVLPGIYGSLGGGIKIPPHGGNLCPHGDSNSSFSLERATSWSSRRWGLVQRAERQDFTIPFGTGQAIDQTGLLFIFTACKSACWRLKADVGSHWIHVSFSIPTRDQPRMGRVTLRFSCGGRNLRFEPEALPVSGLRMVANQAMARASYSRRPQTSHTQAGKLGTVTSSSSSQVKYVMCRKCITPA
jgi:hypothetical protein